MNDSERNPVSSPIARNEAERQDVAMIEERVAELERAQQQESVDGFMRLLTPEAVWVTAHGMRLTSRDEIHEFTRKVLPSAMKDSTASYEVVHVSFIRPDVAVVNVHQRHVTHDGEPLNGHPEGRPVYVMVKEDKEASQWKIAAGHNTQVKEASTGPEPRIGRGSQ